jgi:glycerol kinase
VGTAGPCVLAVDEGTTGVRALLIDRGGRVAGGAYEEIAAAFPSPGWMEQDPLAVWTTTCRVARAALRASGAAPGDVAAVGVTNQRATALVWDRRTGEPIHPALSWQDLRTAERVRELRNEGIFTNALASATKVEWILRHTPDGLARAERGELRFGTVDTWLAWRLTGGLHVTDHSNASCTGLYDFLSGGWDHQLLRRLRLPESLMPAIRPSCERYGTATEELIGKRVPLAALAGDQQAAMFGELGTDTGAVKITYGTSAMIDVNVGPSPRLSRRGAYPTILWELNGLRPCGLEGTVTTAGAAVQWLRDGLGVISEAAQSAEIAASVPDSGGVWAVPALQGLGTPYMDPSGRAAIGGLSRGSTRAHVVRAVLEGIAFRSREVLDVLLEDSGTAPPEVLRADGGAAANDFLLQCLADVLGRPVERPETVQASALGAAYLAGLAAGLWSGVDELRQSWRSGGVFCPRWSADEREQRFADWRRHLKAVGGCWSAEGGER